MYVCVHMCMCVYIYKYIHIHFKKRKLPRASVVHLRLRNLTVGAKSSRYTIIVAVSSTSTRNKGSSRNE